MSAAARFFPMPPMKFASWLRSRRFPVTMTLMGLGSFPGTHPLSLGMLGMHGGYWTNMAMHYSDLLIAVGARFDDRVTGKLSEFCPEARVVHIDIDPTSIKKTFHAHIPIVGDVKAVVRQMNVMLRSLDGNPAQVKEFARAMV